MTVKTLLCSLDSSEISEWQAFFNLEEYEKRFKQERMSADEKSEAIIQTIFRGVECQRT